MPTDNPTRTRRLGRSDLLVSALGLGTNALGGSYRAPDVRQDGPVGYGRVDDAESIRAIHRALDLGVTYFDTADEYGCGRAERVLGRALQGRRADVVISTKFGQTFDEEKRIAQGTEASPAYIRRACEDSLRRLQTDYIDLYLFHLRGYDLDRALEVRETLEALVAEGKIRYYGWSTDDVERARLFAEGPHCTAIMHRLNVVLDAPEMLTLCKEEDLASINRIPLLMGILTGKYRDGVDLPEEDIRSLWFDHAQAERDIARVEAMRPALTADGRTVVQGALGWIWARSPRTIPVPGFKTVCQVEENAGALRYGPLPPASMAAVEEIMGRAAQEN
jgi:aryl-alcohol dehydrogenase-like predicted oxidoreductase